ncbi:glucose/arabinose dehydrogenase [Pontibacter aydingkolensis]|uniref:PQQ-dependent sugar dehydrogenase n=1 Tax=Pontibacter aydingkolensis TaxID=1911536 RepID=A0ABS7CPP6_9BACT|nr:PQQ-dependent sugar dehydrogenase [Pontibacter aydingkolensis]MBW7465821.1 PQQ-dependent sugar dehydrogenase [Pontibacter aydingkolensis]
MKNNYWLLILLLLIASGCYKILPSKGGGQTDSPTETRTVNPRDIALPEGYTAEAVATGLTFPTAVAFDEQGQLYVIEAGYSYGEVFLEPKLLRVENNGNLATVATGQKNGPWTGVTYHNGNFYVAEGGQMTGGKLLRISPAGNISTVIENLPTLGDYHTNGPVAGPDGKLYFGLGTATNSGVVGPDNYEYGWLKRHPQFHDIPCQDVTLTGQNYTSEIPLDTKSGKQTTGAYSAYGSATTQGQVIKGSIPCSGSVLKISPEGGKMELVAWGFRNPFGLAFSPGGTLYVSDNSFDDRGSRPVWGTGDYLWKIENGKWYGWPDFSGGIPFNGDRFSPPGNKAPQPLLAQHPDKPPKPAATLGVHSSSNGLDFSRSNSFGYQGEAFIAQFGDMAPGVGKVLSPVGYKVVRVNVENGVVTDFAANKGKKTAPASKLNTGGLERPVSVKFSPDGQSLYIVDFGIMETGKNGPEPKLKTGVIWKITKS